MKTIREPAVAGMFYPANPNQLKDELLLLFDTAKLGTRYENVIGMVSPHAGYIYSGKTAAYGYNALKNKEYRTVVIISPSHREYFPGISVYNGDAYRSPLGETPVNKKFSRELVSNSKIIFEGVQGHRAEHAVEVQIPFLQMILEDFSIIPVVMGDQHSVYVTELANRLANLADEHTLIVASSDLSHFYSRKEADRLDSIVEKRINQFEYDKLQTDLDTNRCEACGGGAIVAMMKAASIIKKKNSKVLNRTDSGYVTGDDSEVVGYLSAVVY